MSGSEGGENDRNRMTDKIKKEARREGDWEMVSSTSKPTGDRFGDSRGGRRQVCERNMK